MELMEMIVVWEWRRFVGWQAIDSKDTWTEANWVTRKRCAKALKEATDKWGSLAYVELSSDWEFRVRNRETGHTWAAWTLSGEWMKDRDSMDYDYVRA